MEPIINSLGIWGNRGVRVFTILLGLAVSARASGHYASNRKPRRGPSPMLGTQTARFTAQEDRILNTKTAQLPMHSPNKSYYGT
eukprot:297513-Amphidinium_carterae.1